VTDRATKILFIVILFKMIIGFTGTDRSIKPVEL